MAEYDVTGEIGREKQKQGRVKRVGEHGGKKETIK